VGSLQGPELVGNLQDPGLVDSLQEQGDSQAGLVGSQVHQDILDIHQVAAAEVDTGKKHRKWLIMSDKHNEH